MKLKEKAVKPGAEIKIDGKIGMVTKIDIPDGYFITHVSFDDGSTDRFWGYSPQSLAPYLTGKYRKRGKA